MGGGALKEEKASSVVLGKKEKTHWVVEAEMPPEALELWDFFCYQQGSLGAEVVFHQRKHHISRHFFIEPPKDITAQAFSLAFPLAVPPFRVEESALRKLQPWSQEWHKHVKPFDLGNNFHIHPPWSPQGKKHSICMEPGMAFGMGTHPSTRLMVEQIERLAPFLEKGFSLLDVGCGTGILSLVGAMLGAGNLLSIDTDSQALQETRRNFSKNGHPSPLLVQSTPESLQAKYKLVLANLLTSTLLEHKKALVSLVKEGGFLVMSGILRKEMVLILHHFSSLGMVLEHSAHSGDWGCFSFQPRMEKDEVN